MRYAWDTAEPGLSPAQVSASDFGRRWSTAVDGAVYAQPLVAGSTVAVATETNHVYGVGAADGKVLWQRALDTPVPSSTACLPGYRDHLNACVRQGDRHGLLGHEVQRGRRALLRARPGRHLGRRAQRLAGAGPGRPGEQPGRPVQRGHLRPARRTAAAGRRGVLRLRLGLRGRHVRRPCRRRQHHEPQADALVHGVRLELAERRRLDERRRPGLGRRRADHPGHRQRRGNGLLAGQGAGEQAGEPLRGLGGAPGRQQ
ncbi:hypothetical protein EH183_02655 [Streptomyces sp. CB01881]|nr:hypothetical protein C2142_02645 [Streptomyces sp. CB01881]TYC77776.1 hypothetical protein EH183_02655 [Streptomyces sp. CB01881]